ncbi:hypothetical protein HHK36_025693 [Tetracentron sinense]|uniref:Uncharacterized protein n=1 Tax=Tetracentron sinense TaxID=13715 RepID=A0A835D3D4_TETSI|nr:hypothetical protein HHK36_025693 [Tetracentron sinense]
MGKSLKHELSWIVRQLDSEALAVLVSHLVRRSPVLSRPWTDRIFMAEDWVNMQRKGKEDSVVVALEERGGSSYGSGGSSSGDYDIAADGSDNSISGHSGSDSSFASGGYSVSTEMAYGGGDHLVATKLWHWLPVLAGAAGALGAPYCSPYFTVDGGYYARPSGQTSSLGVSRLVAHCHHFGNFTMFY